MPSSLLCVLFAAGFWRNSRGVSADIAYLRNWTLDLEKCSDINNLYLFILSYLLIIFARTHRDHLLDWLTDKLWEVHVNLHSIYQFSN
jgi:hypothetical protein